MLTNKEYKYKNNSNPMEIFLHNPFQPVSMLKDEEYQMLLKQHKQGTNDNVL